MMGIPPVEPHKLAVRGIPISDLPEAAGKTLSVSQQTVRVDRAVLKPVPVQRH